MKLSPIALAVAQAYGLYRPGLAMSYATYLRAGGPSTVLKGR